MNKKLCIGLFGTCGKSTWRKAFIEKYSELGINYFNPQVPNWEPSLAANEAYHLAHDEILVYPILGETYGTGSLAESGYTIAQALKKDKPQHVLLFVEQTVDSQLKKNNPLLADESERARHLVRAHLDEINLSTVHHCQSLDEILKLSLELAQST